MLKPLIWTLILTNFVIHLTKSNTYDVNLDQFIINELNEKHIKDLNGRVTRFNRTTPVFNANFTLLSPIDDTIKIRLHFYALQGNEFRQIFVYSNDHACTSFRKDEYIYESIVKASNLPTLENLPIAPGFYWIKHFTHRQAKPMIIAPGNWRMDTIFLNSDDTLFFNLTWKFKVEMHFESFVKF